MILNSKAILGIPVETRSGHTLGRLGSLDVDSETGRVKTFHVKSGNLVAGLLGDELMIAWDQVVEWTSERLVVVDSALPVGSRALARAAQTSPSASMMEG
jgi:sporulation protein YlmC with PRC-barrel domain